jgi:hypothetical protein
MRPNKNRWSIQSNVISIVIGFDCFIDRIYEQKQTIKYMQSATER